MMLRVGRILFWVLALCCIFSWTVEVGRGHGPNHGYPSRLGPTDYEVTHNPYGVPLFGM